jgi:predicted transcriptional regulator
MTAAPGGQAAADGSAMLRQMWGVVRRWAALRALVSIGCPEQLRSGPLTVTELATRCGADEQALARLLRSAVTTGLLRTVRTGAYELTEAGQALLDGTEALRLKWEADPELWAALGELTETIRIGRAPFVLRHGSMYNYLSGRPDSSAAFDALMPAQFSPVSASLAETGALPETGAVVDVGGGRGQFLSAILRARPALRGILLELERTVPGARAYLHETGVGDRCEVVAGDFFAEVPSGADAYLLAHVVHNWGDDSAARILRTVRSAMPPHGKLLLVEAMVPDDDLPDFGKDLDVTLLSMHEGLARTQAEYFALLTGAGFRPGQVTDLRAMGNSLVTATLA